MYVGIFEPSPPIHIYRLSFILMEVPTKCMALHCSHEAELVSRKAVKSFFEKRAKKLGSIKKRKTGLPLHFFLQITLQNNYQELQLKKIKMKV